MEITELPIITFSKEECIKALDHPYRIKSATKHFKTALGFCNHSIIIGNILYNTVIWLNTTDSEQINGLHEYESPRIVKKRTRTYRMSRKIGHIEETLIHELLHAKKPSMKHGNMFDMLVKYYYHEYHKQPTDKQDISRTVEQEN